MNILDVKGQTNKPHGKFWVWQRADQGFINMQQQGLGAKKFCKVHKHGYES